MGGAATVDPNATLGGAPSFARETTGLAALANHAHTEAGIGGTPDALDGGRGAVDHVGIAPAAELVVMAPELTVSAFGDHARHKPLSDASVAVRASARDTQNRKLL